MNSSTLLNELICIFQNASLGTAVTFQCRKFSSNFKARKFRLSTTVNNGGNIIFLNPVFMILSTMNVFAVQATSVALEVSALRLSPL